MLPQMTAESEIGWATIDYNQRLGIRLPGDALLVTSSDRSRSERLLKSTCDFLRALPS